MNAFASTDQQFLSVFIDQQVFGIPIMQIQDILRTQQLTKIPLAAAAVEGIMNLRGRIVTAINFRKRLNFAKAEQTQSMSVVIEHEGELFSLIVDEVGDVLTIASKDIEDAPLTLNATWREVATGVSQLNNRLMVLLNTNAIFQLHGGSK